MRLVHVDPLAPNATAIADAVATLATGGVVVFPTETYYGLAADPRHDEAVERLYLVKGRAPDLVIPLIAADRAQVETQIGPLTSLAACLADRFWPGPLTLAIAPVRRFAAQVHGPGGSVAVRVPDHAVARALAAACGCPLTSTSANRSGRPPVRTAADAERELGSLIDLILDAGSTSGGAPSTIVDVTGASPVLVRAGAIAWARVLESCTGR